MARPAEPMRIDLHALSAQDAIQQFRIAYDRQVRSASPRPLDVIHGYGSSGSGGVIRNRLRAFLRSQGERLVFRPGEQIDGNPGHTLVYTRGLLTSESSALAEQILAYCSAPRSEEKIAGKFRRFGDASVRAALRELERDGRIVSLIKGKFKHYVAA